MNERFRELAVEAGIDFFNSIDPEFIGKEYCEAWTEQQQKFAELIVRECADIGDLYEGGEYQVRTQILAHFGVEG